MKFTKHSILLPHHGINMTYHTSGSNAPTKTLLFLHGFRGNGSSMYDFINHFTSEKHTQFIALDLPGYGDTPPLEGENTAINIASSVEEFVQVFGAKNVHIIGHSFGSTIAYIIATRNKVTTLSSYVLITPLLKAGGKFIEVAKAYYKLYASLPERAQLTLIRNYPMIRIVSVFLLKTHDKTIRTKYHQQAYKNSQKIAPRVISEAAMSISEKILIDKAALIKKPVLLIAAEQDTFTKPRDLEIASNKTPGADFVMIEDCGHLAPLEKPEEVAKAAEIFINKNSKKAKAK